MSFFNQYSYPLISVALVAGSFLLLWRGLRVRRAILIGVQTILIVVLVAGFLLLRPGASTVDSVASAESLIGNGKPTFVEFFSNYCTGCIAIEPFVDNLTSEIEDEFNVLRIDIHTDVGRELRRRYGFSYTPEFVLFDPDGGEVWRDHDLPNDDQLDLARGSG